ncbi:MAG: multidrug effflux MFS transporter [Dehalococcoidia bacterium]|nr:multidrug effflux MFS transporter [Dehalococcoidia bacterium]
MSIDMFLPSMPQMARDFDTSTASISLAVTLFLLAFAASQLVWGPASDRFGRRPIMFIGLSLFIAGSIVSLFAGSVAVLVASRIAQGFGGGAGPAIGRAMVIDIYPRERATRILAVITVSTALAPMLSPIAGGLLQEVWGWRSVFVVQTLWGIALLTGYGVVFGETVPGRDTAALRLSRMAQNYRTLFRAAPFTVSSLLMGLLFSGHLIFISTSSFVLVDEMGLSPSVFGLAFGSVAVGIMIGATISGRIAGRWEPGRVIAAGALIGSLSAVAMALVAQTGHSQPLLIVIPMMVTASCQGLIRPPAMSRALVPFPMMAGLASAVMGFTQMIIATAYGIGFNALVEPGPKTMTAAIAVASLMGLFLVVFSRVSGVDEAEVPRPQPEPVNPSA